MEQLLGSVELQAAFDCFQMMKKRKLNKEQRITVAVWLVEHYSARKLGVYVVPADEYKELRDTEPNALTMALAETCHYK